MTNETKYVLENTKQGKIDKEVAVQLLKILMNKSATQIDEIAIIGLSAKMPQAEDYDTFWGNIASKQDCVVPFPKNRRQDVKHYMEFMGKEVQGEFAQAGYLDHIDEFDYDFFQISPKEAELMDPNQRLFLQTAMSAIEDAGYGGEKLIGQNVGVYVGYDNSTVNAYRQMISDVQPSLLALATTGNILPIIASRISHILDLKGPSMLIDTTCSSSLLAVHQAVKAIQNGDCNMAIAGSVKINMFPILPKEKLGVEAGNQRTKAFDSRADGTGIGEGVGVVLLKPLKQALKDGDTIYSVIKGSAANNDGKSMGITAPNVLAQAEVIRKALKVANVPAESIAYIEAHGTGTKLGDPIEIEGITRAFRNQTAKTQFCAISSLKSNIGHLDHGAGVASLIKAVLAIKNQQIPPTVHFESPNTYINFIESPVYVNDLLKSWPESEYPRRAGVSSFGLSGTNCHLILEEAPKKGASSKPSVLGPYILVLSTKNEELLYTLVKKYLDFLKRESDVSLESLCYTASVGRGHYQYRLAFIFEDVAELTQQLRSLLQQPLKTNEKTGIFYGTIERKSLIVQPTFNPKSHTMNEEPQLRTSILRYELVKKIAVKYIQNEAVDWTELYNGQTIEKCNLPTYPYAKHRCWINVPDKIVQRTAKQSLDLAEDELESIVIEGKDIASELNSIILEKIANVWGHYLGLKVVHVDDNLFELGGDSIFAAKIVSHLNTCYKLNLAISDIMQAPKLSLFVEKVQEKLYSLQSSWNLEEQTLPPLVPVLKEHYPLTSSQNRLYLFSKLDEASVVYNMPSVFMIEGEIDLKILNQAFNNVIQQQMSFRTSFHLVEGEPFQVAHPDVEFELEVVTDEKMDIKRFIQERIRPFSLEQAPLVRASVLLLESDKYVFFFDMHHIISDGKSTEILLHQLLKAYGGQVLEKLPIQFKDYAVWTQNFKVTEIYQKQLKYWKEKLSGELPILDLPTDKVRPNLQQFHGAKISFTVEKDLLTQLKTLANQVDGTLFMVLLAAYQVLLARYSRQEDIITGIPVSIRKQREEDELVGMFVNTIPLRNSPKMELKFIDFLSNVRATSLEAFANQDIAFEDILNELKLPGDLSRNPMFNAMFMMQNVGVKEIQHSGMAFTPIHFDSNTARTDITLNVMEKNDTLAIDIEYAKSLWNQVTIERMAQNFLTLLHHIALEPTTCIGELSIISKEEEQLVYKINETYLPITDVSIIEEQVDILRQSPAVIFNQVAYNYSDIQEKAERLGQFLLAKGLQPNEFVGIMMPRSEAVLYSMYGILKAGAAYLPIDPTYPSKRKDYMLLDSQTRFVLYDDDVELPSIPNGIEFIHIREVDKWGGPSIPWPLVMPHHYAYMIYTSGSTGLPKGVIVNHQNVRNFIEGMANEIDFQSGKVLMSLTTISFDIFVLESLLALTKGITIILATEDEQMNPRKMAECILQTKATMLQITPSRLKLLLDTEEGRQALHHITELLVGGEEFPTTLLQSLQKYKQLKIYNMYGPTETTVWSTIKELTNASHVTIGKPIANTQVYVVDEQNQLLPMGVPGELLIGGLGVTNGYHQRPDLTMSKFIEQPKLGTGRLYRTGDMVRLLDNNELLFIGRKDHLVKVRGYRVELAEIEKQLIALPEVADAAVITTTDEYEDTQLAAYIILNVDVPFEVLKKQLSAVLPSYMVPDYFYQLEKLPLTPNGKVDRQKLLNYSCKLAKKEENLIESHSELQMQLLTIWRDILQQETISIFDNFFLLGGNSIKAIRMISKVEELDIQLVINDIFNHQTIAELEDYIKKTGKNNTKLTNIQLAEEKIQKELKQSVRIYQFMIKDKLNNVYSVEQLNDQVKKHLHVCVNQWIHNELLPNYILEEKSLRAVFTDEHELQKQPLAVSDEIFNRMIGLRSLSNEQITGEISILVAAHERFEQTILTQDVVKEYRLAPIEYYFLGKERYSGTLLKFTTGLKMDTLNRAIHYVLKQQTVFRNVLHEREGELFWKEYEAPESVTVPYVDISKYTKKTGKKVMEKIVSDYFFKPYEEYEKLYYRMALVKEDEKNYYLFLPVNHSIFDAMSGEIVKRNILEYYEKIENDEWIDIDVEKNYAAFVEQVRMGPVHITDDEIVDILALNQYLEGTKQLHQSIKKFDKSNATYLKFEIRTENQHEEFNEDNAWATAFELLEKFIYNYIQNPSLPVSIFYYGRNYREKKFFNTVGEFIDLIPVYMDPTKLANKEATEYIQSNIDLIERYNLNFSNFAMNEKIAKRYPKVATFTERMQQTTSIIFNFQGKMEDQEMDVFEELLYKRLMHELNMEESVNIYFATRYSNDVIQIDLSLPFDDSKENLFNFFKQECAIISNIEVEKYGK